MKDHIIVDAKSGLIQTVGVTTARTRGAKGIAQLIREYDWAVFGDKGDVNERLKSSVDS